MSDETYVIEVDESTFQAEVVERSKTVPVLVDFWAPWCGPCRVLSPILERVAAESDGAFILAKVNTDENRYLAQQYDIQGIPAVKMFRQGRVVDEFVGVRPEPAVRDFIRVFAPSQIDRWLMEAQSLVYGRRWDEADSAFRRILAAKPGHPQALLEMGRMFLAAGKGAEAASALGDISTGAAEYATAEKLLPLAHLMACAQSPDGSSDDREAEYRRAGQLASEGRTADAVEALFGVLRKDRNYRDGEAKRALLALLECLGEDPSVREYRRQLASVLF